MTLHGKGLFIWQVSACEGGSPQGITNRARAAGLSHVLLKIADTTWAFGFDSLNRDRVAPVAAALRGRGIQAWGWHYVKGNDPAGEARVAVERTRALALDGYVIDAETEYKQAGKARAAETFMQHLRAGLPDTPVALSSFRYPGYHPQIPWAQFLQGCDYNMPQVYWEQAHNADQQVARSTQELLALMPSRPVVPTGSAYGAGGWRPTAADLRRFFDRAQALGCTAANAYSWDWAGRPENRDLWEAVASYPWPPPPRPPDVSEALLVALNTGDPARVQALYAEQAVLVTAAAAWQGAGAIGDYYTRLLEGDLHGGAFALTEYSSEGNSQHVLWTCQSPGGNVLDGNDTLGVLDGKIQYHYSCFTLTRPGAS